MRIILGKNKGKILHPPNNLPVRPTTDLAKESLFNILNNHVDFEAISVLDLFAGTGNITFEFASRGAISVTSVEKNQNCIAYIKKVVAELNYNNAYVVRADVFKYLQNLKTKYDIIFADPPYDCPNVGEIVDLVFRNSLLKPEGFLIIEHDRYKKFNDSRNFFDERRYGKAHFSFFTCAEG